MLTFKSETTADGVTERLFEIEVAGEKVPGLLWAPAGAKIARPLVLVGHGGTLSKAVGRTRGQTYAREYGYATAALDFFNSGDRRAPAPPTPPPAPTPAPPPGGRPGGGSPFATTPEARERSRRQYAAHAAEWRATVDALQEMEGIGKGKVGWWGVSMGTATGVPVVASDPRIVCALFGLAAIRGDEVFAAQARSITVPIEFTVQWNDELNSHEASLLMFETFGSKEKSLHVNPGGHNGIPPHEHASSARFFNRHLGLAADARPRSV